MDNNMEKDNRGKLEQLEERIQILIRESKDYLFTEYLHKIKGRIQEQRYHIDLLENELERSYQIYLQRNPAAVKTEELVQESEVQPRENSPIQEPEIQPQENSLVQESEIQPQESSPIQESEVQSQENSLIQESEVQLQESSPVQEPEVQPQESSPIQETGRNQNTGINQNTRYYYQAVPQPIQKKPAKSPEFVIGVVLFSIIGASFILAAFVMLGMNFMNGIVKGISLYAIAVVLLLVSELLVYKKYPKIGATLSSIGIGGLYLATILNYAYLHNFEAITAMITATVVAAGTVALSWKRDFWLYRIIGIIACYICFLPLQRVYTYEQFITVSLVLWIMNVLCALMPVRRAATGLGVGHMLANAVFSMAFIVQAALWGINKTYRIFFIVAFFAVLSILYLSQLRILQKEREKGNSGDYTGSMVAYIISAAFYILMLAFTVEGMQSEDWTRHVGILLFILVGAGVWFGSRHIGPKWIAYYLMNVAVWLTYGLSDSSLEGVIAILVMLAVAKLFTGVKELAVSEAIITAVACITTLIYQDEVFFIPLLIGLLLSVAFIHRWQCYYEILLTGTLAFLALCKLHNLVKFPIIVGIFFVAVLLFHNIKRFKGKGIKGFNGFALTCQGLCFLGMLDIIYNRAYITYLMMLVFGMAMIVITFHKNYDMDFKYKRLVLSLFLTYMALISRLNMPIVNSIVLMVIALISVGEGFAVRDKAVRIYGLVLSLLVCLKVAIIDFQGASDIQRMIVFFVIGVITLIISGIYIILERKQSSSLDTTVKDKASGADIYSGNASGAFGNGGNTL